MSQNYDVIVLGLGAMGSAALYQLARQGVRTLGIDRFTPPHNQGSTHGDTRITRLAIGEGPEYVPLVMRSNQIWREIEIETGRSLLTQCGGLIMTSVKDAVHHGSNFFEQTVAAARQFGIEHELLDAGQIEQRFPPFRLSGRESGYYEPTAGYLSPEACVDAQIALARKHGAEIRTGEQGVAVEPGVSGRGVTVVTEKARYTAEKVILSLGAWISKFLDAGYQFFFKIYRQVLYWYELDETIDAFNEPHFPVWIWEFGLAEAEMAYGFPAINGPGGGIKIAFEQLEHTTDPDAVDRAVSAAEVQHATQRYVKPLFHGVSERLVRAATCLYTVTPGYRFLLDAHPEHPGLIVASPCSGHGFKHSAAIGEALAQLATGETPTIDLSPFSFARLLQESQID